MEELRACFDPEMLSRAPRLASNMFTLFSVSHELASFFFVMFFPSSLMYQPKFRVQQSNSHVADEEEVEDEIQPDHELYEMSLAKSQMNTSDNVSGHIDQHFTQFLRTEKSQTFSLISDTTSLETLSS